jgi:exodeoxyribonuclease VII small subunit
MTAKRDAAVSFEQLYSRLEETVGKLERGGLPLEESIALYEEGMELAKKCQEILDKAELRITKLRDSFTRGAGLPEQPLAGEDEAVEEEAFQPEDQ